MTVVQKSPGQLDAQLARAESYIGSSIPSEERARMLVLEESALRSNYPDAFETYTAFLRLEGWLMNSPGFENIHERPTMSRLPATTRGVAFKLEFDTERSRVIKPVESPLETDIAVIAGELGIGPQQFTSRSGFIHEEFIEGTPLLHVGQEMCTLEHMRLLGRQFADALKALHAAGILVNDQLLTDDFGKSHVIIDQQNRVRFVDFGASILVEGYPEISDEAVMNLMRTDQFASMQLRQATDVSQLQDLLRDFRAVNLGSLKTPQELLAIDYKLLREGLFFLSMRLPYVNSFAEGVSEIL